MARTYKVSGTATLDTRTFKASVNDVSTHLSRHVRGWSKTLGGWSRQFRQSNTDLLAGAASLWGFKKLTDMGGNLHDLGIQLGMSTAALSELNYAARLSGIEFASLTRGIGIMQKTIGGGEAGKAIQKFGLDLAVIKQAKPEFVFSAIIEAVGKLKNQTERMNIVRSIFGRGGDEFLRLSKAGAAGLEKLRAEARAMGISIDDARAGRLDDLGDDFDKLKARAEGVAMAFKIQMIPQFEWLINKASAATKKTGELTREYPRLAGWVGKLGIGYMALNIASTGVVAGMSNIIAIFGEGITALRGVIDFTTWLTRAKKADAAATDVVTAATNRNTVAVLKNSVAKGVNWAISHPLITGALLIAAEVGLKSTTRGDKALTNLFGMFMSKGSAGPTEQLGSRSREMMNEGRVDQEGRVIRQGAKRGAAGTGDETALDPESRELWEKQNRILEKILGAQSNGAPIGSSMMPVPAY